MTDERTDEFLDGGVFRDIFIMVGTTGANQRGHRIMPLQNEFLAENPVAVQITGRLEFRKHGIIT